MLEPSNNAGCDDTVATSYRQLAEIYHDLLSREGLEPLLDRLVKTVRALVPVASILIAETRTEERVLIPLVAEGAWPDGFLDTRLPFGEGLIGVVAERGQPIFCNEAHRDTRAGHVAGTPEEEPEAIISVPLVGRGVVIGAMSLYREGEGAAFTAFEFELAQRFADAAALALENAQTRAELRDLVRRDELTGLLNRRGFNELLADALAGTRDDGRPVSLLLIDIDQFKQVNDMHGHLCGDALLRHIARLLEQVSRSRDHVCRLGGDEFGVVLPHTEPEQAQTIAQRLAHELAAEPMYHGNTPVPITASTGIANTRDTRPDPESLMRDADRAMYDHKHGRGEAAATLRLVADS
jgi:diguanylate cyclase (GGDEF)-like protein